jgi:hypothetical protein
MAYKGNQVALPLGNIGLVTDTAHTDMPPGALVEANNVQFDGLRVLKSPGSEKYTTSPLDGPVVGLFDWFPNPVTQRMIAVTREGSIYRDVGDGSFAAQTAITTGLATPNNQTFFVEGGEELSGRPRKLFIFTGTNQVQVITGDGTTTNDITQPAADWSTSYPKAGIIHKGRLWAFGNNNSPHRLYASDPEDHEDFTSIELLTFDVFPGDGNGIRALVVYNERLFVFKDGQGAYILDDTSNTVTDWEFNKLKTSFGAASEHSVIQVLNDVLLKNETGSITSVIASDKFGDIESADVLSSLRNEGYMKQVTNRSGNTDTHALYYPDKKQALFTYRGRDSSINNRLMIIDFNEERARVSWEDKDQMTCLTLRQNPTDRIQRPIYGDEAGDVYLYDVDYRSVNATGYNGEIETPWIDFGFVDQALAGKHKIFDALELVFEIEGDWEVTGNIKIDGQRQQIIPFKQFLGNGLDSFILDSSALDDLLGEKFEPQYIRRRLLGSGRRIKLNLQNSGNGQRFTLLRAIFSFRVADEKARRR